MPTEFDEDKAILNTNWELCTEEDWPASDDEAYYEEEVEYLTLDFAQLSSGLTGLEAFKQYQLIGLETETPFFSVGSHVFKGQHETLLGDEILLIPSDSEATKPTYKAFAITSSRVTFQPVTLTDINITRPPPKLIRGRTAPRKPRASTSKPAEPALAKVKAVRTKKPRGIQPMEINEDLDNNAPAKGKNITRAKPAKPRKKAESKKKPEDANAVAGPSGIQVYTLEDMMNG